MSRTNDKTPERRDRTSLDSALRNTSFIMLLILILIIILFALLFRTDAFGANTVTLTKHKDSSASQVEMYL